MDKKILINGKIYTEDKRNPWAEAVAIEGKHFAAVGTSKDIRAYAKFHWGDEYETVDLCGKTVIPGLIEGHTHPANMARGAWIIRGKETEDEEELYARISKAAEEHPKETTPYFVYDHFMNETFGIKGPNNKRLNEIISDRPACMQDNSGHGCVYNSIAIEMLKGEDGIPYNSSLIALPMFVKDENGEYTGWAQQAMRDGDVNIYKKLGWAPPDEMNDSNAKQFFDTFRHYGVGVCMDGATLTDGDMQYLYDLDQRGELNIHYEATKVLPNMKPESIEETIGKIRDWQKRFTTDHIRCNIMKYFVDGSIEFGDVLSAVPFSNDPTGTNCGEAHCTMEEMRDLMVRLNKERLDLHVHCVCDGSLRLMCDACEAAQKICGDDWCIYVTVAHCEIIQPSEIHRIHELGMFMDTTPMWSGCSAITDVEYLGEERWNRMYDYTEIIADGEHVGFSSDVIEYTEGYLLNPFISIQIGMTRLNPEDFATYDISNYPDGCRPPASAKLTLEQMIHGYTVTNSIRMRLSHRLGSIEVGKDANFVILEEDIFGMKPEDIATIDVDSTYFEGHKVYGC